MADECRDSLAQLLGHRLATPLRDDATQFGLEVEGPEAGGATVEVHGYERPPLVGELTGKKVVELVERCLTGVSHRGGPLRAREQWCVRMRRTGQRRRRAGAGGPLRIRTTHVASLFFPGADGS